MKIRQIVNLVNKASEGQDNYIQGSVGFNGYGFIFQDLDLHSNPPYIISKGSHKFCSAGDSRHYLRELMFKNFRSYSNLAKDSLKSDLLRIGSLFTLVPTLQFGGIERLFDVWVFVKTPKVQYFPAIFYWRQSGLAFGGWLKEDNLFPQQGKSIGKFLKFINFSPFDLTEDEICKFLEAFERALMKVPVSDFWGLFSHDLGYTYLGVNKGEPFIIHLNHFLKDTEAEKKIEPLLGREFVDVEGKPFSINILPNFSSPKVYYIKSLDKKEYFFGCARDVLEWYRQFRK